METLTVAMLDGAFQIELREAGAGADVVWLHGEVGQTGPCSTTRWRGSVTCWRPAIRADGASSGGDKLDDIHDAIYFYLDLLDALGLGQLTLVGHGLGGMFAAELAAVQPDRFSHLVLINPFGLWLPDAPTLDYFVLPPAELADALGYQDRESPAARATAKAPEGQEALIAYMMERAQSMAAAARYLWPLPDRGRANASIESEPQPRLFGARAIASCRLRTRLSGSGGFRVHGSSSARTLGTCPTSRRQRPSRNCRKSPRLQVGRCPSRGVRTR